MSDPRVATAGTFSMHDRELMQRPYEFLDRMRSSGCPVAWSEELGGFWFTTNYAAARRVYDDFRTFSSADGTALPKQPLPLYPIDLDPPQQTRMRKLLNPHFLPEAVVRHQPRMDAVVNRFVDDVAAKGEADLQEDVIRPILSNVFLPFLGVPMTDQPMLAHKISYLTRHRADDPETCAQYGLELNDYLQTLITRRREGAPQDDLIQALIDARINDEPLADQEILGVATLVLFGGLDTTSGLLGLALWHLIEHPDVADRLVNGELDFPRALHEYVRYASPIQGLRRTVTRDTELEGCPLKRGDFVMAMNGGANHDPDKFPEPDTVRFDRPLAGEHDHLGFGGGAHLCIGQHFAKVLMETIIRAVLTRLPNVQVKDGFVPEFEVGESRVLKHLFVRFEPSQA